MSRHSKAKKRRKQENLWLELEREELKEQNRLVRLVESLAPSNKDSFFRETTSKLTRTLLRGSPCEIHPIAFNTDYLLQEQFDSLHRQQFLMSGNNWSLLVQALRDLSFNAFADLCRQTVDSETEGAQKVLQSFITYAKPYVNKGDWRCIFEIGLIDIGLPSLTKYFEHMVRVQFNID